MKRQSYMVKTEIEPKRGFRRTLMDAGRVILPFGYFSISLINAVPNREQRYSPDWDLQFPTILSIYPHKKYGYLQSMSTI